MQQDHDNTARRRPDEDKVLLKTNGQTHVVGENEFPLASGTAFLEARKIALESGGSVLEAEGDVLYERFPDGSRRQLKALEPSVPVQIGRKIRIG